MDPLISRLALVLVAFDWDQLGHVLSKVVEDADDAQERDLTPREVAAAIEFLETVLGEQENADMHDEVRTILPDLKNL